MNILNYGNKKQILNLINNEEYYQYNNENSIIRINKNTVLNEIDKKIINDILNLAKNGNENINSIKQLLNDDYKDIQEILDYLLNDTNKSKCKCDDINNKIIKNYSNVIYQIDNETEKKIPNSLLNIIRDYSIPTIICDNMEGEKKEGGNYNNYRKYIKYKKKYLQLKANIR